jgi:hypothetical protein
MPIGGVIKPGLMFRFFLNPMVTFYKFDYEEVSSVATGKSGNITFSTTMWKDGEIVGAKSYRLAEFIKYCKQGRIEFLDEDPTKPIKSEEPSMKLTIHQEIECRFVNNNIGRWELLVGAGKDKESIGQIVVNGVGKFVAVVYPNESFGCSEFTGWPHNTLEEAKRELCIRLDIKEQ